MSHFHKPPRQNVHRGRVPVTTPRAGKSATPKASKANAAFNEHMQRANKAGARATPGQLVAAGAIK
jgi:hypothetical protein